ncbi:venom acid phosphatase Acph-1-like [Leptopilina heterotoma]|uniref:venom acid phosphatase Acph-1-like n=1 Tax=Leptopilina heterotoma TaxID=63436 RepID=UPI001CA9D61B|nr:venom acid phosphatase Acph-1-like [Leptopilina heterotoma]XP_043469988.1 venom acid phosphatase Acph-1-like [Leptopilina heterotoma]
MAYRNYYALTLLILIPNCLCIMNTSSALLKQVNVLFRHGDRTPLKIYPTIPFTPDHYFPAGPGQLTIRGKQRAYELGKILRNLYDDFLGSTYLPKDVESLSSNLDRTKMTLQLVLASLYPPDSYQNWNEKLNWQPIPINYKTIEDDYLFQPTLHCKLLRDEYYKEWNSTELRKTKLDFHELGQNLSYLTGYPLDHPDKLSGLYADLDSLETIGFHFPNWVNYYFPTGPLFNVVETTLKVINNNNLLKRLNGGKFLRQFLENISAVTKSSPKVESNPKLYLYSGHDLNVVAFLLALNSTESLLTRFTSTIIMELLLIDNNYYVKILYYLGIPPVTKELKIFNCENPCPLQEFQNLVKHLLPSDEEFFCS